MITLNPPYSGTMAPVEADVALEEGFRQEVYRCPAGKLTIGYGYNISAGMPKDEALVLMRYRLVKLHAALAKRFAWYIDATEVRQRAILNMAYQLGFEGLLEFRKMLASCAAGDWSTAADHALDSKWATIDAQSRAARVATMLRRG